MSFFEAVIRALLMICGFALVFYLVVWVLAVIGLALPVMVEKILVVILVLVAILILARLFYPWISASNWWGPR
jgi:cytochrome c biogenesis protein CcdA